MQHPVQRIHPILCNHPPFKNRFGEWDRSLETNPALYMHPNGRFHMLVRLVDYKKYRGNCFTMGTEKSTSNYRSITGVYGDGEFVVLEEAPLQITNPLPVHATYWYGHEDIRFVDANTILAACPQANPSGQPCIVLGSINAKQHHAIIHRVLPPSQKEKNWMPFGGASPQRVLYNPHPFQVKGLEDSFPETIADMTCPELQGYHGSTNGIPFDAGGYLFLVHTTASERFVHRWLWANFDTKQVKVSEPFTLIHNSYIEFPCSLQRLGDTLFISLGVNDSAAYIVEVKPPTIGAHTVDIPTPF